MLGIALLGVPRVYEAGGAGTLGTEEDEAKVLSLALGTVAIVELEELGIAGTEGLLTE